MKHSWTLSALVASVSAHGLITTIQSANGVTMPGLSGIFIVLVPLEFLADIPIVMDGVPRDCATPACGAEKDTSIIRQQELGANKASALGRTNGFAPVDAASAIATFLGSSNSSTSASTEPPSSSRAANTNNKRRGFISSLAGGTTGQNSRFGRYFSGHKDACRYN
jgi:hypothetical protein